MRAANATIGDEDPDSGAVTAIWRRMGLLRTVVLIATF